MKWFTQLVIAGVLLTIVAGCSSEPADQKAVAGGEAKPGAAAEVTYFMGARLISGDGSAPIEAATFIVSDGKITAIGAKGELKVPEGAGRVDLEGQTIMPVVVNLHGHAGINNGSTTGAINYSRESVLADLNRYIYYGVGAVALLGTDAGDVIYGIRNEQREGKGGSTRVLTAGQGITVKGGWPVPVLGNIPTQVSSEADARKAVSDLAAKKVDFVKIWVDDDMGRVPKMSSAISKAIIDEAKKNNLRVVAHVFYLADAKELVAAGVGGLVHSIRDREVDGALISEMKQKNVFYTPTLVAHEAKFVYGERPDWLGEQTMREAYPAQLSAYYANSITMNRFKRNPDADKFRQQYDVAKRNLKKMADGGVKIGLGTDSGTAGDFPGYFEHREMELMVSAGMSPSDVIKAATVVSAEIAGVADLGGLAVGKAGDFFVLSTNPLDDIKNTKDIVSMYRNGAEMQRLPLIQNLTMEVPPITDQDRAADRAAAVKEAQAAAEAKLEHFGKFVLGSSANVRAMPIPTPKGATSRIVAGPPDRITVGLRASPADLRQFYAAALPKYRWQAQGQCWERTHPVSSKTQVLCADTSAANSIVLQISER